MINVNKNCKHHMKMSSAMLRFFLLLTLTINCFIGYTQHTETIRYPEIGKPIRKITSAKGYYKDAEKGWVESQNATSRSDKFRQLDIRPVRIGGKDFYMLSQHCMDQQHFFIIEKSALADVKLKEDGIVCNRLPVKYFGSVKYIKDSVSYKDLEDELMRRLVFHENLQEVLNRFTYNFCINTYYDRPTRMVRYYTCFEQKSTVDEYVSLTNCTFKKTYTDIYVSPKIFTERYFQLDVDIFKTFWGIQ